VHCEISKPVRVCVLTASGHGRLRSSSSLFSEDGILDAERTAAMYHRSDRSSAASVDRQSTSSTDRTSIFRLPFPKPAGHRTSSTESLVGSAAVGAQSVHSPPHRTAARFGLY